MGAQGIKDYLSELFSVVKPNTAGEVATYIPALGEADPEGFSIAIATVDGQVYSVGDKDRSVSIQSVSKPFQYGAALAAHGRQRVLEQVGVEPTGEVFNAIVLDEATNRPFNPMVNAGAIATADLMTMGTRAENEARMLSTFSDFAARPLTIDDGVFQSESDTGHRNRAIAYLMLNTGMIEHQPDDVLDLYFKQCSVLVNTQDLAMMAATLANHGANPVTGKRVIGSEDVRDVLTVMATCGMYDYAGQWAFDVGLAAKSGVSGMIAAVVPGQFGMAVYSPRLDPVGNSVRGIEVCETFSKTFALHGFNERTHLGQVIRREYNAAQVRSRKLREAREVDVLNAEGHVFSVLELQGPLVFGAMERVVRRLDELADTGATDVVLDFRRVALVDRGGRALFEQVARSLPERGLTLHLAELEHRVALAEFRQSIDDLALEAVEMVASVDAAMEDFEDRVLAGANVTADADRYALESHEIFAELGADALAALETIASTLSFAPGEVIFQTGDPAQAFFSIAKGTVSVAVDLPGGRTRRVASIGPGQAVGEMALIDGGQRSANVVADGPVMAYAFTVSAIRDLSESNPKIMETLLGNMVLALTQRLRRTNAEVSALE